MRFIFALIFICTMFVFTLNAQVLKVTADVRYEHLQSDEKEDLADFGTKLEQYFNGYEWVADDFEYDVDCKVHVLFMNVQKKTSEKVYQAQLVFNSSSGETFLDNNWEFPYDRGSAMSHIKGMFDPVTHVLDFYAYMILAGELDTNGKFLGDPLYNMAHDIIEQGLRSNYPRGWSQRKEEFQIITDVRTKPLREVKPDFFEALYLFDEGKHAEAYDYSKKVLNGIEQVIKVWPTNKYLTMFFNAHYQQLAMLFQKRNQELNKLVDYDSKHRETYRKYAE
jgi:hypothetical protein